MKIDIFYDSSIGMKLFINIGKLYFKEHGVFPKTNTELPAYIEKLGYPCQFVNVKPPVSNIEKNGISVDEETATALVLRFA